MRCQLKERSLSRAHVMSSPLRSKRSYKHGRTCLCGVCKRCWYVFVLTIHPIHHVPGLLFKPYSPNVYQRLQPIVYQRVQLFVSQRPAYYFPTPPADCLPTTSLLFTNDSSRLFTNHSSLLFTNDPYVNMAYCLRTMTMSTWPIVYESAVYQLLPDILWPGPIYTLGYKLWPEGV